MGSEMETNETKPAAGGTTQSAQGLSGFLRKKVDSLKKKKEHAYFFIWLILLSICLNFFSSEAQALSLGRLCTFASLIIDLILVLLGGGVLFLVYAVHRGQITSATSLFSKTAKQLVSGLNALPKKRVASWLFKRGIPEVDVLGDRLLQHTLFFAGFVAFICLSVPAVDIYCRYMAYADNHIAWIFRLCIWLAMIGVIVLALDFFKYYGKHLMRVQSESHAQASKTPKKVLVLPVSLPSYLSSPKNTETLVALPGKLSDLLGQDWHQIKTVSNLADHQKNIINTLDPGELKNWAQLLRALQPHLESIKTIVLVGSSDDEKGAPGSYQCLQNVVELIAYFMGATKIAPVNNGDAEFKEHEIDCKQRAVTLSYYANSVSFNQINELLKCFGKIVTRYSCEKRPMLMRLLNCGKDNCRVSREELCIDVTGGTKPSTFAGALISMLYGGTSFQYVDTNDTSKVFQYKCSIISPPTGSVSE